MAEAIGVDEIRDDPPGIPGIWRRGAVGVKRMQVVDVHRSAGVCNDEGLSAGNDDGSGVGGGGVEAKVVTSGASRACAVDRQRRVAGGGANRIEGYACSPHPHPH